MWSVLMPHELDRRHEPCERKVTNAGLFGQLPAGRKAHREASDSSSSAVRSVEGATGCCRSFAVMLEAWQRCFTPHSRAPRSCRDVTARWRHDPALSLVTLHDQPTSAVNELPSIGDRMPENRACVQSVPSRLLSDSGKLRG
ncbi:hypothetical protein TRVL_06154 [Trypanosoma vivax]|nr:hypothetical protein TRVL_06154 [Trypanosoma vivax]